MRFATALLLLFAAGATAAHDLRTAVSETSAVVIRIAYPDDTGFSFEAYEITRAGEETPYQTGRTDAAGRIAFLPDRAGQWRLRAMSEDGHGVDTRITTGEAGVLLDAERPLFERHARVVVGVALIFGLFGLLSLFAGRLRRRKS